MCQNQKMNLAEKYKNLTILRLLIQEGVYHCFRFDRALGDAQGRRNMYLA